MIPAADTAELSPFCVADYDGNVDMEIGALVDGSGTFFYQTFRVLGLCTNATVEGDAHRLFWQFRYDINSDLTGMNAVFCHPGYSVSKEIGNDESVQLLDGRYHIRLRRHR